VKLEYEEKATNIRVRIGELEQKIGAGLLEEVIQVAEGELKLASIMVQNRV
jgi:NADH dehydrogenase (ubiquinone) 1 alpha subcomplex subunit 5